MKKLKLAKQSFTLFLDGTLPKARRTVLSIVDENGSAHVKAEPYKNTSSGWDKYELITLVSPEAVHACEKAGIVKRGQVSLTGKAEAGVGKSKTIVNILKSMVGARSGKL